MATPLLKSDQRFIFYIFVIEEGRRIHYEAKKKQIYAPEQSFSRSVQGSDAILAQLIILT
jgi:hypothetical protein